jgi:hypothetical protein
MDNEPMTWNSDRPHCNDNMTYMKGYVGVVCYCTDIGITDMSLGMGQSCNSRDRSDTGTF